MEYRIVKDYIIFANKIKYSKNYGKTDITEYK